MRNAGAKVIHLDEVAEFSRSLMAGYPAPWCIAGGWALDLFLGRVTRPHADLDLVVFRDDQQTLRRHLRDWVFETVIDGERHAWAESEHLALPVHEVHAHSADASPQRVEFLFNEREAGDWVFRRNPEIRLAMQHAVLTSKCAVPVLSPAIVLLFKVQSPQGKDEVDFSLVRDAMSAFQRQWLQSSIASCHPKHRWLEQLDIGTEDGF